MTARRRLSRVLALQTLFLIEHNNEKTPEKVLEVFNKILENDFTDGDLDSDFSKELVLGTINNQKKIDDVIESVTDNWPLDKMSPVDRNILRLGLFEMFFGEEFDVPPLVALNESIELAKMFNGGVGSTKFINGILGKVFEELGEPGKDQQKIKLKRAVGGLLYSIRDGEPVFVLVLDVFNRWTLPKGGIEEEDELETSAVKKIEDEIGIKGEIKKEIGRNAYLAHHPEEGKIKKEVVYFLLESPYTDIKLAEKEGIKDGKWFTLEELKALRMYSDIKDVIIKTASSVSA